MSPYAGHATPGGPSQVRELRGLVIRKCSVGTFDNNAYLLACRGTGMQVLVDAAPDAPRLRARAAEGSGRLGHLVTSHRHHDHVGALAELARWSGATTLAGVEDGPALPLAPDRLVTQGDVVVFGSIRLDVLALRGHTDGGVALAYADPAGFTHLFTRDSLFPGGVGNTKMPGQSFERLYADVTERLFDVFDDDTWVYPGHGDDTTLGVERPHLGEWLARGW